MCAEELYSCKDHGEPILHNTSLELHIQHERSAFLLSDHESGLFYFPHDICLDLQPPISRDSLIVSNEIQLIEIFFCEHQLFL